MAVGHSPKDHERFANAEGHFHTITCSCGEVLHSGPSASGFDAKAGAVTEYGLHLQDT
jgi:hypothetical protein